MEYIVIYDVSKVRKFSDLESAKDFAEAMVNRGYDTEIYINENSKVYLVDKRSENHE